MDDESHFSRSYSIDPLWDCSMNTIHVNCKDRDCFNLSSEVCLFFVTSIH